jgi:beta-glucosidase
VADNTEWEQGDTFFGMGSRERKGIVKNMRQGRSVKVEIRSWPRDVQRVFPVKIAGAVRLGAVPMVDEAVAIAQAAKLAQESDTAVVVVGLNEDFECEGHDRTTINLPGAMNELVASVLAVKPDAIIVTQSGMPVAMPWADQAASLLHVGTVSRNEAKWLTHFRRSTGETILGQVSPTCCLEKSTRPAGCPCQSRESSLTYQDASHRIVNGLTQNRRALSDMPSGTMFGAASPSPLRAVYTEVRAALAAVLDDIELIVSQDIYVGYRYFDHSGIRPLFPFGHGLSYTTFKYSDLILAPCAEDPTRFEISFGLTNSGALPGAEVSQIYVYAVEHAHRPQKELRAFTKTHLQVGENVTVNASLDRDAFKTWHEVRSCWTVAQGQYEVWIGQSAERIVLKGTLSIKETLYWSGL